MGSIVGQLTAQDPDAITVFTYTLVGGSNDNHLFSIDANGTLRTASVSITNPTQVFRSGQGAGSIQSIFKESFTINILNLTESDEEKINWNRFLMIKTSPITRQRDHY